jgi:hypothetical protein
MDARYQDDTHTLVVWTDANGHKSYGCDPYALNEIAGQVRAWVANGNTIQPYIPPALTAADVNRERDRRLERFTFAGKAFDFCDGKGSDININGAGTVALGAIIEGKQAGDFRWANADSDFKWVAADNSAVLMDALTCLNFAKAAAAWKERHIHAARALKNTSQIPPDYKSNSHWPT